MKSEKRINDQVSESRFQCSMKLAKWFHRFNKCEENKVDFENKWSIIESQHVNYEIRDCLEKAECIDWKIPCIFSKVSRYQKKVNKEIFQFLPKVVNWLSFSEL